MSFAYFDQRTNYCYSSDFPAGIFSTRSNLYSFQFYHFLYSIFRFNFIAKKELNNLPSDQTIYEFLIKNNFNEKFINEYVLPMGAAIWSTSHDDIKTFPVKLFVTFWNNHCLLQVFNRPQWRTIKGGSYSYINALIKKINLKYFLNQSVKRIKRHDSSVSIYTQDSGPLEFDAVVLATHADQALRMLELPNQQELNLLGKWSYSKNKTILHTCPSIAPKDRNAWASWIYTRNKSTFMTASYYMNRLQGLTTPIDYFVSLNSTHPIEPNKIEYQTYYEHPIINQQSVDTQPQLNQLNGQQNTFFCGSYFGNGFHEDGIRSAVQLGSQLGCQL